MAFKTNNAASGGSFLTGDLSFINADNTKAKGYDDTTGHSNQVKIKASDGATSDRFGRSVAIGSGKIVVSAYLDADNGTNSGSAYIYDLDGTNEIKITASDGATDDLFGVGVAIGSGKIVVGAYGDDDNGSSSGSAYIFDLNGTQLTKIKPSDGAANDFFSYNSVAIGSDRIVVGASGDDDNGGSSGSAYLFDLSGREIKKIKPSDGASSDNFSYNSVAIGSGRIVIGAWGDDDNGSASGSAYIFDLDGNQLAKIKPSDGATDDQFGYSVAIGSGRICVGAYGDGDNGSYSGSAYLFDLDGTQLAKIKPSDGATDDNFGFYVAIGSDRICIGAYGDDDNGNNSGSAYTFDLDGNQISKITASDGAIQDYFGYRVAIGSGKICIGAWGDDDNGGQSGSAYIFDTPNNPMHILDIFDDL